MKTYRKKITWYHGTTKENAMSIVLNGTKELFMTTSIERAKTYGDTIVKYEEMVSFEGMSNLMRVNNQIKKSYLDMIFSFQKNKLCLTVIDDKEEMTYFMWKPLVI